THFFETIGNDPVVDPRPSLVAFENPRSVKDLQVMRHRRLRQADRLGQMTDACLGVGLRGDETENAKPYRIGQRLERGRELGRLALAERRVEDRRTAGTDFLHARILTDFDVRCNIDERQYPPAISP